MSSSSNSNSNNNDEPSKDTTKQSPNKTQQTNPSNLPEGYRIPFAVQIGGVSTLGDVMSGKATFEAQHTMNNPTPAELLYFVREKMEKDRPSESGPIPKTTPAPVIRLPNNGFPGGTCAGCGAEDGEDGGALRQCARCKGRKYCGRACQKGDWPRHRGDCVEG